MPRSLKQLLLEWQTAVQGTLNPQPPEYAGPDVLLEALVEHSDDVRPGTAFIARVRVGSDGHRYIDKAVERGAALIIGQQPCPEQLPIPYLQVTDTAIAEAWLAAAWEGFPGRELTLIGVTGTDGKTTTTNLIFEILRAANVPAGMLSTIKAVIGPSEEPLALHVTTPEAPVIQGYLRRMVTAGLTHCVLETTSHALAQHRIDSLEFDLAVVTNITHEHLDYHGDYEGYLAAKARLFENLQLPGGKNGLTKTAILNNDDRSYDHLAAIAVPGQLSYGFQPTADIFASDIEYSADATRFLAHFGPNKPPLLIESALVGDFNVANMLAALATAHALALDYAAMQRGLASVPQLSGRMERINAGQSFLVVVDFAHTPNALEKAIAAARRMSSGRIITVFGSAGKRDVQKRRLMAEISASHADLSILTAEDPRTESLDDILAMMADGCRRRGGVEGQTFWRVPDRSRAIYHALELARPEDLVLVCGKGHEQSICFGSIEYPWDDRLATRLALQAFLTNTPLPNSNLPTF